MLHTNAVIGLYIQCISLGKGEFTEYLFEYVQSFTGNSLFILV